MGSVDEFFKFAGRVMSFPTALVMLAAAVSLACERPAVPDDRPGDSRQSGTYLALGDSYTIGEGVSAEARWPVVLAASIGVEAPKIVARTGWTVSELEAGVDAETTPDAQYEMVTLLIGVNDEFRGVDVETYRVDFERILGRALAFGGDDAARVTVVSIPDYGVTPFGQQRAGVSERIDAYNEAAAQIATSKNVRFVDVTGISREMPTAVVADGLHPNEEQYGVWAATVAEALPL